MWFLKFLLAILIIYLLAVLFFRYLLPWLLKLWVKRLAKRMNPEYEQKQKKEKKANGEMNIDYIPENKIENTKPDDDGEYVDYEEIK